MADKITKKDLVEAVYKECSYLCDDEVVHSIVTSFINELEKSLENRNSVELRGLGVFDIKCRKGRKASRNPRTGEVIESFSHYTAVFKPGKKLNEALRSFEVDE